MNRGYVKVWRKITDSGLMQMPNTFTLFMHILMNAAHKNKKVGTTSGVIDLKVGQYISGRTRLASDLKQSEREIRTSLSRLEQLEIISIKTTNKYSIYTIENYSIYQEGDQQNDQQETIKRPSNDHQTTTKQTLKHLSIKEDIDTSKVETKKTVLVPYQEIVDLFHNTLPTLKQVYTLNETRKRHIKKLWIEELQELKFWKNYFVHVGNSKFLMGAGPPDHSGRQWQCTFDWIIKPDNFIKISEDQYHETKVPRRA